MIQTRQICVTFLLFVFVFSNSFSAETETSYKTQRDKYLKERSKQKSSFTRHEMDVMSNATKALAKSLPNPGIKAGEKAPDFTLADAHGELISLSKELKKGPVVLVFYRGAWCPFCNLHLRSLQQALPDFKARNAQLILVTPQKPDKSLEQFKKKEVEFRVLSDLDGKVMKAYKLYYKLDPQLVAVYKKHGLDVEAFNGKGRNELPVPGSFVIDQKGKVIAMHANTDYKERMEPADIIRALDTIK